jgi:hypothetical protein
MQIVQHALWSAFETGRKYHRSHFQAQDGLMETALTGDEILKSPWNCQEYSD